MLHEISAISRKRTNGLTLGNIATNIAIYENEPLVFSYSTKVMFIKYLGLERDELEASSISKLLSLRNFL